MSARTRKLVGLSAAALCLILVPATLADFDESGRAPSPLQTAAGRPRATGRSRLAVRAGAGAARSAGLAGAATVVVGGALRPIPRSYLGLSIEYWGLPLFERRAAPFVRVLAMLTPPGDGPMILRIGGDSADRSFWDPGLHRMPTWAFRLMPRWLQLTRTLLRSSRARVILDLNLVTGSPLRAAAWARAARAELPRGTIAGFEIGNEPDIYDRPYWLAAIARAGATILPPAISPRSYLRDFDAYADALRRFTGGVPLLGPAVANPHRSLSWIAALARGARPKLGTITGHRYPYSACLGPGSKSFPTISRLLSERATAGNAEEAAAAAHLAHRYGLPFRMTEINSVTCGGRAGVSNAFATALWAPDALFELLRAGVDGVNVHVRADAINAAMVPTAHGIYAHPLLYGLILFARTLGPDPELATVRVSETAGLHLKAWAVRVSSGVHVLLINKGARAINVDVHLPGTGPAELQRMLAPSPSATSSETLAGQRLTSQGTWSGPRLTETVLPGSAGYAVRMPAASAALLIIR